MDLSGRTNVDLTEAARLMKQPTTSPTVNNPGQMQPPPLMMMQQAVAMQQFQFQQALLMQQVMATQQAAARAATVKSAAEMAAARAAEISKQLKGSDDEDEKKPAPPSPRRSKSHSPSRSRSVSRSKSRSPIRYRRGRSPSRSPIRYRRDRAYSPSRGRDFYSYRSRSRRGYYRGRGDHYWSPFRRDWDRDRDRDYYPRHRRSRSRSRSRGRRRSRTRSRSPRYRRERTPSPRRRREERRSVRSTRRSRSRSASRETKRSISSKSPSASPQRTENSSSPIKKVQESGSDIIHRDDSKSPVRRIVRRDVRDISVSPEQVNQTGSPEREERERSLENDDSFETKSDRDSELPRKAASVSPLRSLSVSLNHSRSKDLESDDEELDISSKGNKSPTGPLRAEYSDDGEADHPRTRSISPEDSKPKVSSSDVSSDEIKDGSERNGHFALRPTRSIKMEERRVKGPKFVAREDSDEDRGLDDWRDDVKGISSERIGRRDGKQQRDKEVEERKPVSREFLSSVELARVRSAQANTGKDRRNIISGDDVEQPDNNVIQERQHRIDSGKKDFRRQESFRYRGRSPLAEIGKVTDLRGIGKHKEDSGEEDEKVSTYLSKKSGAQIVEEAKKQEPSFKAYTVPAGDLDSLEEAVRPALVEDYKDEEESDGGIVAAPHAKAKEESDLDDEVKVTLRRSDYDEDDKHRRRKDKDKRSRDRKLDDQEDRKKRKERHKRHRKKHRRDEGDDRSEDDDDEEGRKERRRHKRRHRREDDDSRRDRKKRKQKSHKSRGKSASDSAGESPKAEVDTSKDEEDESPIRRKTSSRHKKRRREPSKSPVKSDSSSD